jgi:hypothetical protein
MLVHLAERIKQIALFRGLHSGRRPQIENGVLARPEGCSLIRRRQEALAVDCRAGTDAALGERELAAVTGGSLRTILGRVWAWMGGPTNGDGDGGGSNAVAGVRG